MMSSMRLPALADQARFAALGIALLRDVLGQALVGDHDEVVAGIGHARQAEHLHRDRRAGRFGTCLPVSSNSARTRPYWTPQTR